VTWTVTVNGEKKKKMATPAWSRRKRETNLAGRLRHGVLRASALCCRQDREVWSVSNGGRLWCTADGFSVYFLTTCRRHLVWWRSLRRSYLPSCRYLRQSMEVSGGISMSMAVVPACVSLCVSPGAVCADMAAFSGGRSVGGA